MSDTRPYDYELVRPYTTGDWVSLQRNSGLALAKLTAAWERQENHSVQIERAAMWYGVRVAAECVLLPNAEQLEELSGSTATRYEVKAAMQTIPSLSPFTRQESRWLAGRQHRHNFEWDRRPGRSADTWAMFDRWHSWLWRSSRSKAPSPEALEFAEGCKRLNGALAEVIAAKQA